MAGGRGDGKLIKHMYVRTRHLMATVVNQIAKGFRLEISTLLDDTRQTIRGNIAEMDCEL